jgi:hypothetical protein
MVILPLVKVAALPTRAPSVRASDAEISANGGYAWGELQQLCGRREADSGEGRLESCWVRPSPDRCLIEDTGIAFN